MPKLSRRTISRHQFSRTPYRPTRQLPAIRPRSTRSQPRRDPRERLWLWGFLAATFFFLLTAEHWGFRIAVGLVALGVFFAYLVYNGMY
jgi:hypothetical protein